ncbi:MAG: hypothetical protein BGO98_29945 [Myxococcales bacterium 68-20]|nr:hypothetical protein [Myxococcales bacterium]OJY16313.1 MAG: hypothetical protein BGO98_29945 [Myxococcales bacterium 68-20]
MRLARWVLATLPLAGAVSFILASCSGSPAPASGAVDAGERDDARASTGGPGGETTDSGADADGGIDPLANDMFKGKWKALPGAPSFCDLRRSEEPEKLASKWLPCPSGRQGCRKLDTSWTKYPPANGPGWLVDISKGPEPTRLIGGKPYFLIRRFWHSEVFLTMNLPIGHMYVLEPLDGAPVVAIATGPVALINNSARYCKFEVGYGDYGIAYQADLRAPTKPATQDNGLDESLLGWAPWASLGEFTTRTINVTDFGLGSKVGYFLDPVLGERSIWFSTRAPRSVGIFELGPQSPRLLQDKLYSESPTPVPGGALVYDVAAVAINFAKDDGSFARVVTPASPQVLSAKALDRSNGNALVWVESDRDIEFTNSTLWTAPFATTEGALARRKVAKLHDSLARGGGGGVANRGVFLSLSGRNEATIVRLEDGVGWKVTGEPGERFTAPVWVDDDEAILQIAPDPDGKFEEDTYGIVRIARSTLGPPTVPPGL